MEKQKSHDEMLSNSLEKVIFNKEELENLKRNIDRLSKGQCKSIELKRQILNYRANLFERIQRVFQFYHNSLTTVPDSKDNQKVYTELEEKDKLMEKKDKLFEELGKKISTICKKIRVQLQN